MRRRRALGALGGCLVGSLSGCAADRRVSEVYRYERDAPVGGPVAIPWRTQAHDALRSGYNRSGRLPPEADVDSFAHTRQPIETQPAFIYGIAYFGANRAGPEDITDLGPTGLKASEGRRDQWFFTTDTPLASPTVVGDAIFVTNDGMTRALDRRDGTLCWEYHQGSNYPTASPTAVGDTVYVTGERVFALTATTGEVQWATTRPETIFRGTAATDAEVFATAGSRGRGAVYGFDPETGRERWRRRTNSEVLVPPVLGEFTFAVEAGGRLLALDVSDGSEAWSWELDGSSSAMPAVADGTVYVAATSGNTLRAIDESTGDLLWESTFPANKTTSLTVGGNTVYVPATVQNEGFVYGFGANTGVLRELYQLPEPPMTPLVVGSGVGLIGTGTQSSGTQFQRLSRPES